MPGFPRFTLRVPAQQLHLFDPARPLLLRFGAGFFKAVPSRPGVYIMGGEAGRVLYIGQSGNLRRRLHSYKNARLDRAPRKVVRLVHCVRSLVWEECETAAAARFKETQLLRVHRPKFNVVDTYPPARRHIGLARSGGKLQLSIGAEPPAAAQVFGPFRSGATRAFGALLRLAWAGLNQPESPHDFPARLLRPKPPGLFVLEGKGEAAKLALDKLAKGLETFFAGESGELIELLVAAMPNGPDIAPFQRVMLAADVELLTAFYDAL